MLPDAVFSYPLRHYVTCSWMVRPRTWLGLSHLPADIGW